jgi:hypothetical protein
MQEWFIAHYHYDVLKDLAASAVTPARFSISIILAVADLRIFAENEKR